MQCLVFLEAVHAIVSSAEDTRYENKAKLLPTCIPSELVRQYVFKGLRLPLLSFLIESRELKEFQACECLISLSLERLCLSEPRLPAGALARESFIP